MGVFGIFVGGFWVWEFCLDVIVLRFMGKIVFCGY